MPRLGSGHRFCCRVVPWRINLPPAGGGQKREDADRESTPAFTDREVHVLAAERQSCLTRGSLSSRPIDLCLGRVLTAVVEEGEARGAIDHQGSVETAPRGFRALVGEFGEPFGARSHIDHHAGQELNLALGAVFRVRLEAIIVILDERDGFGTAEAHYHTAHPSSALNTHQLLMRRKPVPYRREELRADGRFFARLSLNAVVGASDLGIDPLLQARFSTIASKTSGDRKFRRLQGDFFVKCA